MQAICHITLIKQHVHIQMYCKNPLFSIKSTNNHTTSDNPTNVNYPYLLLYESFFFLLLKGPSKKWQHVSIREKKRRRNLGGRREEISPWREKWRRRNLEGKMEEILHDRTSYLLPSFFFLGKNIFFAH